MAAVTGLQQARAVVRAGRAAGGPRWSDVQDARHAGAGPGGRPAAGRRARGRAAGCRVQLLASALGALAAPARRHRAAARGWAATWRPARARARGRRDPAAQPAARAAARPARAAAWPPATSPGAIGSAGRRRLVRRRRAAGRTGRPGDGRRRRARPAGGGQHGAAAQRPAGLRGRRRSAGARCCSGLNRLCVSQDLGDMATRALRGARPGGRASSRSPTPVTCPPLLVTDDQSCYLESAPCPPVGVVREATFSSSDVRAAGGQPAAALHRRARRAPRDVALELRLEQLRRVLHAGRTAPTRGSCATRCSRRCRGRGRADDDVALLLVAPQARSAASVEVTWPAERRAARAAAPPARALARRGRRRTRTRSTTCWSPARRRRPTPSSTPTGPARADFRRDLHRRRTAA